MAEGETNENGLNGYQIQNLPALHIGEDSLLHFFEGGGRFVLIILESWEGPKRLKMDKIEGP